MNATPSHDISIIRSVWILWRTPLLGNEKSFSKLPTYELWRKFNRAKLWHFWNLWRNKKG